MIQDNKQYETLLVSANAVELCGKVIDLSGSSEISETVGGVAATREDILQLFAAKFKAELEKKA